MLPLRAIAVPAAPRYDVHDAIVVHDFVGRTLGDDLAEVEAR